MSDEYQKRLNRHHQTVPEIEHQLLEIAQRLCPGGHWLLQIIASQEFVGEGENGRIYRRVYHAIAHNGDDNVTATGKTVGAATAQLIYYLLNGSVFPLTGNAGRFNRDVWEQDIAEAEDRARQEGMKAAAKMAYDAGKGATREADIIICERRGAELEKRARQLQDEDKGVHATIAIARAAEAQALANAIRNKQQPRA